MNPTNTDINMTLSNGDLNEIDVPMVPSPLSTPPSNYSDSPRVILIPRKRMNSPDVKSFPLTPHKISRENNLEGCNTVNRALNSLINNRYNARCIASYLVHFERT